MTHCLEGASHQPGGARRALLRFIILLAVARYGDCFCVALRENSAVDFQRLKSGTNDTEIGVSKFITISIDITHR